MPALISGTQALGEPRYPSLKGIMAARTKEIATLSPRRSRDRPGDRRPGGGDDPGRRQPTTARRAPRPRSSATRPAEAARQVVDFLAERRII